MGDNLFKNDINSHSDGHNHNDCHNSCHSDSHNRMSIMWVKHWMRDLFWLYTTNKLEVNANNIELRLDQWYLHSCGSKFHPGVSAVIEPDHAYGVPTIDVAVLAVFVPPTWNKEQV